MQLTNGYSHFTLSFSLAALGQGLGANPQHMMQFAPLLYSYQMAMAQAAQVAGMCGAPFPFFHSNL